MPYNSPEDINERVYNILCPEARLEFMQGYNNAYEYGNPEQVCFQRAWGAVKRAGFKKNPMGVWTKEE